MSRRVLIHCDADRRQAPAAFGLARTLRAAGCSVRVLAGDPTSPMRGRRAAYAQAIEGDEPRAVVTFDSGAADDAFRDAVEDRGWRDALMWARPGALPADQTIVIGTSRFGASDPRATPPPSLDPDQRAGLEAWRARHLDARLTPGLVPRPGRLLVLLQPDDDPALAASPFRDAQAFVRYLEGVVPADFDVALRIEAGSAYRRHLTTSRRTFRYEAAGRLHDRIAEAELVVGVSAAGLIEAALMGKPVVAFGPGAFSGAGVVCERAPGEPFPQTVDVDADRREAFFHDLIFKTQIDVARLVQGDVDHLTTRRPFSAWLSGTV